MGVMQLLSLKFSTGWFMPFQMVTSNYIRNSSRLVMTRVSQSTGDLPYILCHWVWSCCSVCWQSHQCSTEVPLTSKVTTEASLTVPELYMPTPPGCDNCPAWGSHCKGCLKEGHWKPSVIPARTAYPLLQWTTKQKVHLSSMEGRGKRLSL